VPADDFDMPDAPHAMPEQSMLPFDESIGEEAAPGDSRVAAPEDEEILHILEGLEAEADANSVGELGGAATPELPFESAENGAAEAAEPGAVEPEPPLPTDELVESESTLPAPEPAVSGTPLWPFIVYDLVWAAFAVLLIWQLLALPPDAVVYDSAIYDEMLYAGVILTAAGPLLIVVVWMLGRRREEGQSKGTFVATLVTGAIATLIGVALWWAAMLFVDYIRLGQLF